MKKFEVLVQEMELLIQEGLLLSGEKIPSVREMSETHGVSINTVLKAYLELERKDFIQSRPQSGYYVMGGREERQLKGISHRSVLPGNIKTCDLVSSVIDVSRSKGLTQFGAAYVHPDFYPSADIRKVTRQVLRENPEVISSYELSPGSLDYRRQVARQLRALGCKIDSEDLLATTGAAEAVSVALRATCSPGSIVIAESPIFFGTIQALEALSLRVIEVRSDPIHGIDLDQLKEALKKHKISAAVVMPNFSNPLGSAMPDEKKSELVKLFEHHDIPLIEDDIYAEIPFQGPRPKPLKAFDESGIVITCSSFSKTISPGLRIGWIAPGKYYDQVRKLQLSSTMGAGALAQKVLCNYLSSRQYEKNLRSLRLNCSIEVRRMSQEVLKYFPEETRVSSPQGGFVLWVELPKDVDSVELYQKSLEKKISFSPGIMFSADGVLYRNYLRLNCGNPWDEHKEDAIKTLGLLARKLS